MKNEQAVVHCALGFSLAEVSASTRHKDLREGHQNFNCATLILWAVHKDV